MKSCTPSSLSRLEMAVEIDGCEMLMRSEASVIEPVSPAATKYSSWRKVKRIRLRIRTETLLSHGSPACWRGCVPPPLEDLRAWRRDARGRAPSSGGDVGGNL